MLKFCISDRAAFFIQVLRQEKKHLKSLLASVEADVEGLEEGKVLAEARLLLEDQDDKEGLAEGVGLEEKLIKLDADLERVLPRLERDDEGPKDLGPHPMAAPAPGGKDALKGQLTMEELLDKIAAVQSQLAESNKENLHLKQLVERYTIGALQTYRNKVLSMYIMCRQQTHIASLEHDLRER